MVVVVLWWVDVALLTFWSAADLGVRYVDEYGTNWTTVISCCIEPT